MDVCLMLRMYCGLPFANSIDTRTDGANKRRVASGWQRAIRTSKCVGKLTTIWKPTWRIASQTRRLDKWNLARDQDPGENETTGGYSMVRGRLSVLSSPGPINRKSIGENTECPRREFRHPWAGGVQRW